MWFIPESKLDEYQKRFLEEEDVTKNNYWLRGFPGSGKSILLAHSIKKIKNKDPKARIAVVVYTHAMIAMFKTAFSEMGISVPVMTVYDRSLGGSNYDYILCDEVQDMTPSTLKKLRGTSKRITVSGDENQSIYDYDVRYGERTVGSTDISGLLQARPFLLNMIHRLSKSIINCVQKLLPFLNIFNGKRDMTKIDTQVRICEADDTYEEAEYIIKEAEKRANIGESSAILLPTHNAVLDFVQRVFNIKNIENWSIQLDKWGNTDYDSLNSYFQKHNIKMQYVGNRFGKFDETVSKINIMTYHSSKGLDFDNVFMPGLNKSLYITPKENLNDTVFMVAMTRSRNNLYLTYSGEMHNYLRKFFTICSIINIHDNSSTVESTDDDIFGF